MKKTLRDEIAIEVMKLHVKSIIEMSKDQFDDFIEHKVKKNGVKSKASEYISKVSYDLADEMMKEKEILIKKVDYDMD